MEVLLNLEEDILMFFQGLQNPVTDIIMQVITFLGDTGWFWIAISIILAILPKTRKLGINCSLACAYDVLLVNVLVKNIFKRIRPYELFETIQKAELWDPPSDFSFPSGHTAISFAAAIVIYRLAPKKYGVSAMVLASLIALSRLYFCVHYPTDIIGGILAGAIAAFAAMFTLSKASKFIATKAEADTNND